MLRICYITSRLNFDKDEKMTIGTVKFFNNSKGYGFINNDETGKDCFVHVNSLNGVEIKEDDKVEFEEEEGQRGVQATNVKLA